MSGNGRESYEIQVKGFDDKWITFWYCQNKKEAISICDKLINPAPDPVITRKVIYP